MHRTTNFQTSNIFSPSHYKSYTNFNPQTYTPLLGLQIKDSNLQIAVNKLIKENQILTQKLHREKQKNYDLLQVKRKLQEDMHRLQFQLERMGTYQNLNNKEIQIKKTQVLQDNRKLQIQLDQYFQENKKIRTEMRKYMTQCENLAKQKQQLVNQNIILLNQITDLKSKLANNQAQVKQYKIKINQAKQLAIKNYHSQRNPSIHDVVTVRSINQKSNQNSKQQLNSFVFDSPQIQQANPANYKNHRIQLSTNPSEQKINFSSPDIKKLNSANRNQTKVQKIYEDFYEDNIEPSPRSFSNQRIQRGFQFVSSPANQSGNYNKNINIQSKFNNNSSNNKSPSVISYMNNQSPQNNLVQQLKFTTAQNQYENQINSNNHNGVFLQTFQKKQLKQQVAELRNQIINDFIQKYKNCLKIAEKQKSNSLKIFINQLEPKIQVLNQMVMNYLQAKQMLVQSCPTLRFKWQPINPLSNPSFSSPSSTSFAQTNNSINVSTIYQKIKQNSKKEKTLAGQYLALFRYLTLLNKIEQGVDQLLIDCIKHSALKQIYRIKKLKQGDQQIDQ